MEKALAERLVGTTVAGKYRIRRIMGAGSMGVVCEAEHLEIGKRLAIKLIDASLAGMSDIAMRFRQEARAASLVESHHIVQVFDVGADEKLGLYLVMEYLTGEDLAAMLVREKRLTTDVAVRIAVQVARGLAKAHEAGVVHRDLKPANIFLTEREDDEPLVKILDFGISKVIDASRAESKLKLTRAGTVVGTPQYMSPEQAQGFSVDERTDVWALGLVLYEMLAGRPAYQELPTYEAFIIHLVSHPPDALRDVAPWVPAELAKVVHQAIEHVLEARIATCVELARRLLEAHPLPGFRTSGQNPTEMSDTWADPSARSPYFDEEGPSATRSTVDEQAQARAGALRESPDDSLSIDVQVEDPVEATPPPPRPAAAATGKLASSGIRTYAEEPSDEFPDDAPQFFDRKSLERVGPPSSAPRSGEVVVAKPPPSTAPPPAAAPTPSSAPARAPAPAPAAATAVAAAAPSRLHIGWAALVFVALGLAVAIALAMR
ncbi:MAG TPA: serine/threonine-protein kinase [Polyangiaceae bacterium]